MGNLFQQKSARGMGSIVKEGDLGSLVLPKWKALGRE